MIITRRNAGRLASAAAEIGALPVSGDATDPEQVTRMADEVGSGLDVLVNVAGAVSHRLVAARLSCRRSYQARPYQVALGCWLISGRCGRLARWCCRRRGWRPSWPVV
jgi:NAD(P)-dependent dehydrogenase (short-subunit alcohol dehydrogenase family)